jgi:hypothetical protein
MYRGSSRATILALRSTCGSSLYSFHPSAWKVNSANYFAFTEFSELCEAPVLSVTLQSQFASVERHP